MQHQDNRAAHDEHHGDEQARQDQQLGGRIDIPPGILMPPTVLVTALDNGTLILQGRPDGPRVWLEPDEAAPLRRALAAAFDRCELAAAGSDQGKAP